MIKLPKAKTNNIIVQESGKELLLYNLSTDEAFCLNEPAAIIYQACDSKTTFAEIKSKNNFSDEIIFFTLNELNRLNLLNENYRDKSPFGDINRRQALRKIGWSSLCAVPVITSIVAPAAAAALSSCRRDGQFAGNYSVSGVCGSYPSFVYEEFCDGFANRCCTNQSRFGDCTTLPGNPPGSPPFSAVNCNCGA